ncbi:MAG: myo-inositol 2-dehydrogenase/D-chiro-inositol 1-dehydrogenase [Porticoccaceae bacterium]|jgi:myo-inositol 2-dehydrogenase/D-chiro-inositol 1-dehydrogenase
MLGIALLGSGRMADVYGPKINAHPKLKLEAIFNPNFISAQKAASSYGGSASANLDDVLANKNVGAVVIATPTNTHLQYIEAAAKVGLPIYCEKPLDESLERVDQCLEVLDKHPVPFMLGFNRRFDPDITALQEKVRSGSLGQLNFLMSTSREPSPPPLSYSKACGGYFVDATIHDIDLVCWISGERPFEVFAAGSCMIDPDIGALGDSDTTMTILKMPSGCLVHINNCRRCSYGFDQRLEVFGEGGMIQTSNQGDTNLVYSGINHTDAKDPLKHFFLERYDASFFNALDEFQSALNDGRPMYPSADDGKAALAIALACAESRDTGQSVKPCY